MNSTIAQDYEKMMNLYYQNPNSKELEGLAKEYGEKYGEEKLKEFWRESDGF